MLILFKLSLTGTIIPNPQNPLIITNPIAKNGETSIIINFQLPPKTNGLAFSQYIGVVFPKLESSVNLGTSSFKFNQEKQAKCTLFNQNGLIIETKWTQSESGERNIAYCKITDLGKETGKIPLVTNRDYRLVITLLNPQVQKPKSIYWQNFDMFTSTSANLKGMKFDTVYGIGQGCIFKDNKTNNISKGNNLNQALNIEDLKLIDSTDKEWKTAIYQYENFNFRVRLKTYFLLKAGTSLQLWINFPNSNLVDISSTTVTSTDVNSSVLNKRKISGDLKTVKVSSTQLMVSGFTDP